MTRHGQRQYIIREVAVNEVTTAPHNAANCAVQLVDLSVLNNKIDL